MSSLMLSSQQGPVLYAPNPRNTQYHLLPQIKVEHVLIHTVEPGGLRDAGHTLGNTPR